MLFEYAVDPELLSDFSNCRALFDNFQVRLGRTVSDVPKKWVREANKAINDIPHEQCRPVMKKSLKRKLKILLEESLCTNRPLGEWNRNEKGWLDLVVEQNSAFPFAAVITKNTVKEPLATYAMNGLLFEAPECWNCRTQKRIPRDAKSLVDTLHPLFLISKEITIIDPHMDPRTKRFRKVLREIIRRLNKYQFGKGIKKLTFYTVDWRSDMEAAMNQHLLDVLPSGFEVVCCQWPEDIMHDRFVLTDVGCISFGIGLDEHENKGQKEVRVSLVSKNSLTEELEPFKDKNNCTKIVRITGLERP